MKAYGLDARKVKVYGTPEGNYLPSGPLVSPGLSYNTAKKEPDLANDPNVDLVVTCIRVDRHAGSLIPAIKAGKDVYVEWPIESNYAKAKELMDMVKLQGVQNVLGLQGGFVPIAKKIKNMIVAGDIGRVESGTFVGKLRGGAIMASNVDYLLIRRLEGMLSPSLLGILWSTLRKVR